MGHHSILLFSPTDQEGGGSSPLYDPFVYIRVAKPSRSRSFLFGSFSFVSGGGYVDNSARGGDNDILLAWPCERIGQTAERMVPLGSSEARPGGTSRRLFAWSTRRPDTILGQARIMQGWFVGHKLTKEILA